MIQSQSWDCSLTDSAAAMLLTLDGNSEIDAHVSAMAASVLTIDSHGSVNPSCFCSAAGRADLVEEVRELDLPAGGLEQVLHLLGTRAHTVVPDGHHLPYDGPNHVTYCMFRK